MRSKLILATATILVAVVTVSGNAHAETKGLSAIGLKTETTKEEPKKEPKKETPKKEEPKPVVYVVRKGDTLIKLSKAHKTPWQRVWAKNRVLQHPDLLKPGQKLTIPRKDEKLPDRPVPTSVQLAKSAGVASPRSSVASGNTYTPGQCTWYVKNRKPSLPNNLGNADTWFYRARAQGLPTGYTPRAGAAAQRAGSMHVVYVERVNGDGTIVISEMNYNWVPFATRTVTVSASNYWYIY